MDPLHTRMLALRLSAAGADLLAEGRLLDLRRRGFETVTGAYQNPGAIHDMSLRVWISFPELRVARIEPIMSSFPFPPGTATGGESCPDQLAGVQRVVGADLRDGYGGRLLADIGGVRGCLHLFTLLRLLGPTVEQALAARAAAGGRDLPTPGSPLFARTIVVDGLMGPEMSVALRGTLLDALYPATPGGSRPERAVDETVEVRVETETELPSMVVRRAEGRLRRARPHERVHGGWQAASAVASLVGQRMSRGYSPAVENMCAASAAPEPVRDLLIALAPAAMQTIPSISVEVGRPLWRGSAAAANADFCHMWRSGGPLLAAAMVDPNTDA
jgi:hypothetical protein